MSKGVERSQAQVAAQNVCCTPKCHKNTYIALGVITLLGSAIGTWLAYGHIGNWSFVVLGGGVPLGVGAIFLGARNTTGAPKLRKLSQDTSMVSYSFIESKDEYKLRKAEAVIKINNMSSLSPLESRAMGVMLGMPVGDSVGAPYEFEGYNRDRSVSINGRFALEPGQWTDDASMGLCLADSLIANKGYLDEANTMVRYRNWWHHGYNNAFTGDSPRTSVGLGGNIGEALRSFEGDDNATGPFATDAGDKNTSGNGGLMRLGAVALVAASEAEARDIAARQSRVTHQGDEAAACCELMATVMYRALHNKKAEPSVILWDVLENLTDFKCDVQSVNELATSSPKPTKEGENWDWKNDFTFNSERLKSQPGYIGSYAMDALAMALHCVWSTNSFEMAVLKAGTHGGDADTVAAITGQIAGAIYGVQNIPKKWIDDVQQWDRSGEIAARALLLLDARNSKLLSHLY